MKIGLISDTHSFLDPKVDVYFENCDEVWHIGDFGISVADKLKEKYALRGVYGNIDEILIREEFPEYLFFEINGLKVLMIHIGGYPGRYTKKAVELIKQYKPQLVITGHSHICKVMKDTKNNLLHINPGAAGNHGFHQMKTIMRFEIEKGVIKNLQAIELGLRSTEAL
jgi:uncharacterized protein